MREIDRFAAMEEIEETVRSAIRDGHFQADIEDFDVKLENDWEGSPITVVHVRYCYSPKPIDFDRTMDIERAIFQRLRGVSEDRLPYVQHDFSKRDLVPSAV